jgi:hypothetical protein
MRNIHRRLFLMASVLLIAAPALAAPADDSLAVVTAIYKRVSAGKGDGGGQFVWAKPKDRARYFSKRTVTLWREADAKTAKGDQGPIGFDPVTNSQDPQVKAFDAAVERQDANTATVVVHISDKRGPIKPQPASTIRYDLVREGGRWAIDDIRGTVDSEWSVRKMLSEHKG